jgi:hypothetical protein
MPAENEHDPLDRWLNQQVRPLPPPPGTFELITRRARRRRVRKAVVTVASAAAVAAAVGVAVPVGMSLNLSAPSTSANLEAGGSATRSATETPLGKGTEVPSPAASSRAASPFGTTNPGTASGGYLPPNFQPYSVTWDSLTNGWIIGPAGTPGHCANANPDICTSVARTSDGGQTWHGLPAPDAGAPDGPAGVSGIRFLDGTNGWAFGPELWDTHDGGKTWAKVPTGGQRVTDLETAGNRAYALFAQCDGTNSNSFADSCTSYTLMTTTADSDQWVQAGAATSGLTGSAATTAAAAGSSGMIALYGTTGYLVAPDGTLYSGPAGGTWRKAGTMPCPPGTPQANGLPGQALIALIGPNKVATFCAGGTPAAAPAVYTSTDSGATWTPVAAGWTAAAGHGTPTSLAATSSGALVLATGQGIYLLPAGAGQWQASSATGAQAPPGGFSYVGMTSTKQGVALPASTSLHEIWMTTNGGQTWQARPIQG